MLTAASKPVVLQFFRSAHFNVRVSLWAIKYFLVQLCSSMFMTAGSRWRYSGLRVTCHSWDKCPLVSSQDNLCCAPLGGKPGVWLARELNFPSRSTSWHRQCALGMQCALQGSPIPWWGNCQVACVGCSTVEHPLSVLQALYYSLLEHWWWGRAVQQCLMVGCWCFLSSVKQLRNNKTCKRCVYFFISSSLAVRA